MQSSHAAGAVDIAFDDPNLVADAGLVSVVALAEQVGLPELVDEHVRISGADNSAGANPAAKVMSLVAGMVAGADSIEDTDRLRHAGNTVVFDQIRAPSTLGTFLRAFTHVWNHSRSLPSCGTKNSSLESADSTLLEFPSTRAISSPKRYIAWSLPAWMASIISKLSRLSRLKGGCSEHFCGEVYPADIPEMKTHRCSDKYSNHTGGWPGGIGE